MLQMGAALLTAVSLPSCNGIFEGIYDEPSVIDEFGFTKVEQATSSGTIYIDATSYTRWNYLDFETFALDTTFIAEDGSETGDVTEGWDFAVHRYETGAASSRPPSPPLMNSLHPAPCLQGHTSRTSGPRTASRSTCPG